MTELVIERQFAASRDRVFATVTQAEHLLTWWGPEGMHVPEGDLALDRVGPWWSVMQNAEGGRYKVSGMVTEVSPPHRVRFTWGWHDDTDQRGEETLVSFELEETAAGGTLFRLRHGGFSTRESASGHSDGWTSSLRKLTAALK